ncbi:MAG: zinc-binding alcohol dehydrogenase [Salinirussus sp.]
MTARALSFVGPREVAVRSVTVPDPGDGEVTVEAWVSGISPGTELKIYRGEAPTDLAADPTIDALDGDFSYPLQYGYSTVGEVTRLGPGVDEEWLGRTVFGFHPHQSRFTAATADLCPVPESVPAERAALLPTAETATNLVMDGAPGIGERVVVFGAGVVGLFVTAVLSEFPLESLTVVEPLARRRELAASFGADRTRHPDEAGELGDRGDPPGADLVYELSGAGPALDATIDVVGYDGTVVVGSWYGRERVEVDLGGFFHRGRVDVVSSQVSSIDPRHRGRWDKDRRMSVAWDRLERVDPDPLITHRLPFDEAQRAYRLLDEEPGSTIQVLLTHDHG